MVNQNNTAAAGRQAHRPAWRDFGFRRSPQLNFDIPETLLAEVDFKWLMAGQGWWVDVPRFDQDTSYAAQLLHCAMESDSATLRISAAALMAAGHGYPVPSCGVTGTADTTLHDVDVPLRMK